MTDQTCAHPTIFTVETVLGCNLSCQECAIGGKLVNRKYGHLSLDRYMHIADKVKPYCEYMYLHLWGEPMLNKDIISMIRHASSFTKTNISTNANKLNVALAKDLILSGVSDVIVSIDGFTQEVYERYRWNGDVGKALKMLSILQHLNQDFGSRVQISPQFIVFRHNQHEMDAFAEFCRSIGLEPVFKAPYIRAGSTLQPSDHARYVRNIAPDEATRLVNMRDCANARNVFTIQLDGTVVGCCYDHNGLARFGNIFEEDILAIWHSDRYTRFRDGIRNGRACSFCLDNCLLY